jgi:hypothetical protein
MNYQTVMSPLQLNAAPGWYQGGAVGINAIFSGQMASYESTELISPLMQTVAIAVEDSLSPMPEFNISSSTINSLRSMGSTTHPILGNSIPRPIRLISPVTGPTPYFMTLELRRIAEFYISDLNKFVQAFAAADGYINTTNRVIDSAVRANEYLGPTFTNMDDLVTSELSSINLALDDFGDDLADLGNAIDPAQPEAIGLPSSILNQITLIAGGLPPAINDALLENGVDANFISGLPTLPDDESGGVPDQIERDIFRALEDITGADLDDALSILGTTTPNLQTLADLLNPVLAFPRSFASLTFPTPAGAMLIYNLDGTINSDLDLVFESGDVTVPAGCDQLAKIIPPDQARANQALQIAFGQLSSVGQFSLPDLAMVLR